MSPTILTASGQYFDFQFPAYSVFSIYDIAHALSHLCRFTGHTREFYSVAQHSVLVSRWVPDECALAGLLHDAAEAFIGDVSKPLKRLLPDYAVIEQRVEAAVRLRFGLPPELPDDVKKADLLLLNTERRDLMAEHGQMWTSMQGVGVLEQRIQPLSSAAARQLFIDRFFELGGVA